MAHLKSLRPSLVLPLPRFLVPLCILLVETFASGMAQMVAVRHTVHTVHCRGVHPDQVATL